MSDTTAVATPCFFKQIDEKHITQEVKLMLWNPKMDLIALAFTNADIHLYRMNWQKVWTMSSPIQNLTITSMAWRPDGKVLAVAYSNGHLKLLAVEDAKKIFSFNCNEPISYLYWLQESDEMASKHETHSFYEDISATQLPKPISYDMISQLFEKTNNKDFSDNLFIKETKNLTYLVCAHGTSIAIFVYGYFLLVDANLDIVPSYLNYKQLQACFLSDNTSLISTLGLTDENLLVYSLLDARILQDNHIQIKMISTKFGMLFSMLTSVKSVIKEMEELWEDILVEMDQKFQLYALEKFNSANKSQPANSVDTNNQPNLNSLPQMAQNQNNDGSLVNDFMMLYAFGTCSDHFKNFLLNELTEKGLKKLESSVENYYSNIQRLLSGNFHQISLCIFYHLNELYGMSKWFDKFKIFSLTEKHINDVLNNCASLILKAQELNFVIDQNMKEIKLFFKWLHSSMIHLSDNDSATDMIRFNEEMENSIIDFIQNTFKDAQTINLEKIGQYLKQDNLKIQLSEDNNWQTFLKTKLTQKDNECLFLSKREKSLVGCFNDFKVSLNDCFKCQAISNPQPFSFIKQYNIHKFNSLKDANEMLMSYKCFPTCMITGLLMAKSNNECYILKHPISADPDVKAYIINLSSHTIDLSQVSLQDAYIYGENSVTLLGTDSKTASNTYLIHLNLQTTPTGILNDLIEVTSYSENGSKSDKSSKETNLLMIKAEKLSATSVVKCIKKLKSSSLCVSSSRKVAALLSSTKHRVKIFELECEDEDEEEMEENDSESVPDNEENPNDNKSLKSGNASYQTDDNSDFSLSNKLPPSSPLVSNDRLAAYGKSFTKNQSAGSTCSMTPSVCSSTAATIGSTTVTLESSTSSFLRGKRKKNFDDDDDDDETTSSEMQNLNIMPQINNVNIPSINLQPSTPSHANEPTTRAERGLFNQFYNSHNTHSPSATLTPGRKSASPHFFYPSSDYLLSRHLNSNNNQFNGHHHNHHLSSNHHNSNQHFNNANHHAVDNHQTSFQISQINHDYLNLKIPTTPTRSKSLSPSLRSVIQPPRLRHKQQNKLNGTSSNSIESNNNNAASLNLNISSQNDAFSFKSLNSPNKLKLKVPNNDSPYHFEPIGQDSIKNSAKQNEIKSKSPLLDNYKKLNSTLNDTANNKEDVNKKIDTQTIKKPIPVAATSLNRSILKDDENSFNNVSLKNGLNKNLNVIDVNDNKNVIKVENKNSREDIKEIVVDKFKLPLNVRRINLKNFPPNQVPNAKRMFSVAMQKIRSANSRNSEESLNILKLNIQPIVNEQLKKIMDICKTDFVDPALKNIFINCGLDSVSSNDISFMLLNLIDDAKNAYINETEGDSRKKSNNENDLSEEPSPNLSISTTSSSTNSKRKNELANDDPFSEKNNIKKTKIETKKFNSDTKFVLGKIVNELFINNQQQTNDQLDETNEANHNNKSIYTRYPNIYKYEADHYDRKWLTENSIIKRKNLKCYILVLSEAEELITSSPSSFHLDLTNNNNSSSEKPDKQVVNRDVLIKKLKPFSLPDSILYKLNKHYSKLKN